MKKKKSIKITLIGLVLLCLLYIVPTYADSGWDSSYDSGGSSSWGSSSSSSSWSSSSSSSSSGRNNSSSDLDTVSALVVIGILWSIFIVFFIMGLASSKSNKEKKISSMNQIDIEKIKAILPNFDEEKFKNDVYETYKKIQIAWMDFDYETLRKYTTDELYNLYHTQLVALKAKKQKNIMKDFELLNVSITGFETNENTIALKVFMAVECFDYVVDKNEKVVRGTANRKLIYLYEMTFIKGLDQKNNKCPNCNAPLENVNSSKCPYCDSTIIGTNYDFVLSKKQMLSQKMK